uniref:Floral homeotic protein APETALA 1 n=1 Tax=Anthurium amnicola TaxID=1678845 RepID=A0A1D1XEZ7_9ARAE
MGRGKVQLKRIENKTNRQITFSKRRNGLLKKGYELSILCDAVVGLVVFSATGKIYQYSSHDMDSIIARYRNVVGMAHLNSHGSRTAEYWRAEIDNLKKLVDSLEARDKHLAGEELQSLGIREVKQLERQMRTGLERVLNRKKKIISEHINQLKKKKREHQEKNTLLHQRLQELDMASGLGDRLELNNTEH